MKPSTRRNLAIFCILLLTGCQKEIDWGLGAVADQLLVKIYSKSGTDSTVVVYSYNSAKQLIGENTSGISGTTTLDNNLKIVRTSSGIIDRTVQTAAGLVAAGIDSVVTYFHYDATTSKYTYSTYTVTLSGLTVTDSTIYTYDALGKIVTDEHYQITGILPPMLNLKNLYTYSPSGLNLASIQQSAVTTLGGPLTLVSTETFTPDTKKNPLITKNEAILLNRTALYSVNNFSKTILTNAIDPSADFTLDVTFRYNTATKPDSAYTTKTPGGTVTASKFYYQ